VANVINEQGTTKADIEDLEDNALFSSASRRGAAHKQGMWDVTSRNWRAASGNVVNS